MTYIIYFKSINHSMYHFIVLNWVNVFKWAYFVNIVCRCTCTILHSVSVFFMNTKIKPLLSSFKQKHSLWTFMSCEFLELGDILNEACNEVQRSLLYKFLPCKTWHHSYPSNHTAFLKGKREKKLIMWWYSSY